jgi:hypothetical protein
LPAKPDSQNGLVEVAFPFNEQGSGQHPRLTPLEIRRRKEQSAMLVAMSISLLLLTIGVIYYIAVIRGGV